MVGVVEVIQGSSCALGSYFRLTDCCISQLSSRKRLLGTVTLHGLDAVLLGGGSLRDMRHETINTTTLTLFFPRPLPDAP